MRVWKKHFYLKKKLFYKKNIKTITKLKFGNIAFTTSQVLILNSIFLLRFILFLKKIARKSEKTLRYFWLTPRSYTNVTLQSKGARMGKGKGKKIIKLQRIGAGVNFVEFSGMRYGRLKYYLYYMNIRFNQRFYLNTQARLSLVPLLMFFK